MLRSKYMTTEAPKAKKGRSADCKKRVRNGKLIANQYGGHCEKFLFKVQGLANPCVVGGAEYDTFCGRKWKWEHVTFEYMNNVLGSDQEYFVCTRHKTSEHYGEVVKFLTPGLRRCLAPYSTLPRPVDCDTFFVPCNVSAPTISWTTSFSDLQRCIHVGLQSVAHMQSREEIFPQDADEAHQG